MINKKKLNFSKKSTFLTKKISADSANTTYTIGLGTEIQEGEPDILWQTMCFIKDTQEVWVGGLLYNGKDFTDLIPTKTSLLNNDSKFVTIEDTDKKYMPRSGSTGGSNTTGGNGGAFLSISNAGSFNNYGNNGLAFNAVRDLTGTTKYLGDTGSGYVLNAASFGVKDNGTTSFSHKKYDSFNKETGAYTNAKNTAVLSFSGNSGLMYAKNTSTSPDVAEAMYKYVGVIDSPDERLKVYSAALVDTLISKMKAILTRLGATDEEIATIKL